MPEEPIPGQAPTPEEAPRQIDMEARIRKHLGELRKTMDFASILDEGHEQSRPGGSKDEEFLREKWNEHTFPFTQEELKELLSSEEFGKRAAEAIEKTDDPKLHMREQLRFGQEFGFVVFHHPGDLRPTDISPLFEGEEKSINLYLQSEEYRRQNPNMMGSSSLIFHTHPNILPAYLLNIFSPDTFVPESDYFSIPDLKTFKAIAEDEDTSLIFALGTGSRKNSYKGRLLLVSFNNLDAFQRFNPEAVVTKCREYKKTNRPHTDVYREAGLNVAILNVNLKNSSINPKEVERASTVLTNRIAA